MVLSEKNEMIDKSKKNGVDAVKFQMRMSKVFIERIRVKQYRRLRG